MRLRAFTHLTIATVAAAGAITLSLHLAQDGAPARAVTTASAASASAIVNPTGSGPSSTATAEDASAGEPARRTTGARNVLEQRVAAPATEVAATAGTRAGSTPVDESKPHEHVVDPEAGGLIPVAGAVGTVPAAQDLGPVHADPMPTGVDLADPTDTASLLERAGVVQAGLAAADQPVTTGASAPIGTPGIATLGSHVAPSCTGDGADGKRVQVLYAHEQSTPSRYGDVLPLLRNEVANVDDVFAVSSEQTGGGRRVRWVHDADCLPVVVDVTVPDGALGPDFWATIDALKTQGYNDPNRKYMVFADANQFCGIGTLYNDLRRTDNYNDGFAASFARVDANCWSAASSVPAHELTHTIGGVQQGAPHATPYGHCSDDADIMCYDDGSGIPVEQVCAAAQEDLLDCNHDDYFSTAPAPGTFLADNWNTASSSFLDVVPVLASPPDVTLDSSGATAETGETVTFTATSTHDVTWAWSTASGCSLTPDSSGTATLVCPSTETGTVAVTATATDVATGVRGSATSNVSVTPAAAPTVRVTAPATAMTGTTFAVSTAVTGKPAYGYAWTAGSCTVATPTTASTTVQCPAGSSAQSLLVAVTVTQADGQTVRGTATVAITKPTATSWSTPRVSKGTITSTLSAGSATLAGAPVTLQVMWSGTTVWTDAQSVVTSSKGVASGTATYKPTGTFRFVYAGDATRASSVSPQLLVKGTQP